MSAPTAAIVAPATPPSEYGRTVADARAFAKRRTCARVSLAVRSEPSRHRDDVDHKYLSISRTEFLRSLAGYDDADALATAFSPSIGGTFRLYVGDYQAIILMRKPAS